MARHVRTGVVAKDVMLFLCGQLGMEGGRTQAVHFRGEAIRALPMQERMTLANMTAELGGQTGLCDPDETTAAFIRAAGAEPGDIARWQSDADATPAERHRFDASALTPQVAAPHSPANAAPVADHGAVKIDVAHIGACTGAKLVDLRMAASVLKGRKVDPGVSLLVAPASRRDQEAAASDGTLQILIDAGATLLPNACGMCAGYNGTLAGERDLHLLDRAQLQGPHGHGERQHLSRLALHRGGLRRARPHLRSARDAVMSTGNYGRAFVYGDGINTDMLAPGIYMKHPIATIAHALPGVGRSGFRAHGAAGRRRGRRPGLRHRLLARAGRRGAQASRRRRRAGAVLWRHLLSQRAELRPAGAGVQRGRPDRRRRSRQRRRRDRRRAQQDRAA